MDRPELTTDLADKFAALGLAGVDCASPHCVEVFPHFGDSPNPQDMHPAFFGCYDWHSAVHSHWMLVRLLRFSPDAKWESAARDVLTRHLTPKNIAGEVQQLTKCRAAGAEKPYGWGWLLQLAAELQEWGDAFATELRSALCPLERLCRDRLADWVAELPEPIRSGEHIQSAFGMSLGLDYAAATDDESLASVLTESATCLHANDRAAFAMELSGYDFLSPSLSVADLMRRALPRDEFSGWWSRFQSSAAFEELSPVECVDPADGKLSHWQGLNLSRAWMLEGIAVALGSSHAEFDRLNSLAAAHAKVGIDSIDPQHYAGTHWLGSFATYFLTRRGLR